MRIWVAYGCSGQLFLWLRFGGMAGEGGIEQAEFVALVSPVITTH